MRYLCLILAASLLASPAWSQESDDGDRASSFEEGKSDFDYLLGEWRFTSQHAEWGEASGFWTAVRLPTGDGSHILDEYRIVADGGETLYVSTTLRAFNATTRIWDLVSAERGTGLQDTGTARKVGDEMHIDQRFGPSLWRIRYYDIRPDGFSWVADVSMDEGATWHQAHLRIQARRIGPARSLEPLGPPRPGDR